MPAPSMLSPKTQVQTSQTPSICKETLSSCSYMCSSLLNICIRADNILLFPQWIQMTLYIYKEARALRTIAIKNLFSNTQAKIIHVSQLLTSVQTKTCMYNTLNQETCINLFIYHFLLLYKNVRAISLKTTHYLRRFKAASRQTQKNSVPLLSALLAYSF